MPLFEIFKVPQAKILDLFFQNKDSEYIRQLIQITKIPRRTLERYLPILVNEGFILKYHPSWNRRVYFYRFNGANLLAHTFAVVSELDH